MRYFFRMPVKEKIIFAKRLGLLINSGIPIVNALSMLEKQSAQKSTKYVLRNLIKDVENGRELSAAMDKYKKVFGEFAINLVRVGENGSALSASLTYLAGELKKKQELKRKIVSALVYPIFIALLTFGITGLLMAYVFPKILPIFQSFKAELPLSTRILIFLSSFFLNHGLLLLVGTGVVSGIIILLLKNKTSRLVFDKLIIYTPIFGQIFQAYELANFTRTLGLLLESGLPLPASLKIVAATQANSFYKKELRALDEVLFRGDQISKHMEFKKKIFPPALVQMVAVGETAGNLSSTLTFLAEMYEDDLNNFTKNLSTTIEPVLMIFMGLMVGFVAISIITPIYSITQNLHP